METRATTWRAPGRPTLHRADPASVVVPEPLPEPEGEALPIAVRLALLSVLAFLPVIACRWVFWDDSKNFLANPHFRGLGWTQIAWAWRATLLGVYQPLSWMLLEAEYCAWGLKPQGYHIVSLGLHAANVVALFAVTVAILRRCLPGLAAARPASVHRAAGLAVALFAVHPLRGESVAWISAQPYLPSSLCGLLAVLAYLKAQEAGRTRRGTTAWLAVTLGLFVVAMLFKSVAISLPLLLLILDVYPLRRLGGSSARSWVGAGVRRVWVEKLPFLVVSLVFVAVAMQVRPRMPADLGSRLASAACAVWFYPAKTLVPLHLRVIYAPCAEASLRQPFYAVCAAGAVAFTAAVVVLWRRWPGLAAAWLSYLVILAPNSGLVRITSSVAADRYSYIASMGLVVLLAGLFCLWAGRRKPDRPRRLALRLAGTAALAVVVLGLCVLSWFQTATWKSGLMLWTQAVGHGAADSVVAQHNLGNSYSEIGLLDEALDHFAAAALLRPDQFLPHMNVGITLLRMGRYGEAVAPLTRAIQIDPASSAARTQLGMALLGLGDLSGAEGRITEALRLDPNDEIAHNNLGLLRLKQGRTSEAIACFTEALRLGPDFGEARDNLEKARAEIRSGPAAGPSPAPGSSPHGAKDGT